jgi:hypothetical protein
VAIFRCSKCGCDEDTALCNYWSSRLQEQPIVCSACDPKIGKWHDEFPQKCELTNAMTSSSAVKKPVGLTTLAEAAREVETANDEMANLQSWASGYC